jgi:hypothetical protein
VWLVLAFASIANAAPAPSPVESPAFRPNGTTEPAYPPFDRPAPARVTPVADGYRVVVRLLDDAVNPWVQKAAHGGDARAGWLGARVTFAPGEALPGLVLPAGDVDVSGGLLLLRGELPAARLVGKRAGLSIQLLDARGNLFGTPFVAEVEGPVRVGPAASAAEPGTSRRTWIVVAVAAFVLLAGVAVAASRRSASRP